MNLIQSEKILVTGAAGFIGYYLSKQLLDMGCTVVGIDNLNDYYDVNLKNARLTLLQTYERFAFHKLNLADKPALDKLFIDEKFDIVVNLAAQAGVRYSIANPEAYINSNIIGFFNILEACRYNKVQHLVYASSSSVYGTNKKVPFSTEDKVDNPVSLYAATKKSNELLAHTYSHLYGIPTTGLRFFTVYGPWGRPDMAYYLFTDAIFNDKPIKVFNHGRLERDFTYIDDIIEATIKLLHIPPTANPKLSEANDELSGSFAPYNIYNIGNRQPVQLEKFISVLEKIIGKKANIIYEDMQPGDVLRTCADVSGLEKTIGFKPITPIEKGLRQFVDWYIKYHRK